MIRVEQIVPGLTSNHSTSGSLHSSYPRGLLPLWGQVTKGTPSWRDWVSYKNSYRGQVLPSLAAHPRSLPHVPRAFSGQLPQDGSGQETTVSLIFLLPSVIDLGVPQVLFRSLMLFLPNAVFLFHHFFSAGRFSLATLAELRPTSYLCCLCWSSLWNLSLATWVKAMQWGAVSNPFTYSSQINHSDKNKLIFNIFLNKQVS